MYLNILLIYHYFIFLPLPLFFISLFYCVSQIKPTTTTTTSHNSLQISLSHHKTQSTKKLKSNPTKIQSQTHHHPTYHRNLTKQQKTTHKPNRDPKQNHHRKKKRTSEEEEATESWEARKNFLFFFFLWERERERFLMS